MASPPKSADDVPVRARNGQVAMNASYASANCLFPNVEAMCTMRGPAEGRAANAARFGSEEKKVDHRV
ncbi:hypothetical protein, partial [Lysobacter claricitrinus]|uniref:hypothetical protein n=1 Tax=Lysobacter claricitrinus TaxID=3367728 RepID=UPI0038B30C04